MERRSDTDGAATAAPDVKTFATGTTRAVLPAPAPSEPPGITEQDPPAGRCRPSDRCGECARCERCCGECARCERCCGECVRCECCCGECVRCECCCGDCVRCECCCGEYVRCCEL